MLFEPFCPVDSSFYCILLFYMLLVVSVPTNEIYYAVMDGVRRSPGNNKTALQTPEALHPACKARSTVVRH